MAGAPARPSGRARLALRVPLGLRRVGRAPRRPDRAGRRRRARRLPRAPPLLDGRLGGRGRRPRRPGALRAGMGRAAWLRERARHPARRRRAHLPRPGERRPPRAPGALPRRRRRGRAARRPRARGPALGESALRLGRGRGGRLPLVDRAPAPHVRALRPDAHRSLPRLRLLLGDPRGCRDREGRRVGARAGCRRLPRGRGRARAAARDRRGPRLDHARRGGTARRARLPGDGRPPLGVLRLTRQPAPAREPSRARGRLHLDARYRHARGALPAPRSVAPARDRPLVACRARDRPGPGRARPRQRGADEPAGRDRGQLELAARAGAARRGARRAPAPGDGGGGAFARGVSAN